MHRGQCHIAGNKSLSRLGLYKNFQHESYYGEAGCNPQKKWLGILLNDPLSVFLCVGKGIREIPVLREKFRQVYLPSHTEIPGVRAAHSCSVSPA